MAAAEMGQVAGQLPQQLLRVAGRTPRADDKRHSGPIVSTRHQTRRISVGPNHHSYARRAPVLLASL